MWHGYYLGGGWWMMGFGVLFWASIIVLIVWIVQRGSVGNRRHDVASNVEAPLDCLKSRYAKGEIDQDEYERIRKHLQER
jgi:putative membrane protein